jgi:hypothetical protein
MLDWAFARLSGLHVFPVSTHLIALMGMHKGKGFGYGSIRQRQPDKWHRGG